METKREVYLSSKRYHKAADVFMVFSKRRLNSLDVVRHSVEKPHKTCNTQVVSSIVFESSYCIGSSQQNSKKEFYDPLVWPSISILSLI